MIAITWRRHDVDGIPVDLLTGEVGEDRWLRGIAGGNGMPDWRDTDTAYPTEVDALAGAFLAWQEGKRA